MRRPAGDFYASNDIGIGGEMNIKEEAILPLPSDLKVSDPISVLLSYDLNDVHVKICQLMIRNKNMIDVKFHWDVQRHTLPCLQKAFFPLSMS